MGIILIILLILLFWGVMYLANHPNVVMKWMMRRLMPPQIREQMKQQERQQRQQRSREKTSKGRSNSWNRRYSRQQHEGPIIPKEYAQDVEFTETRIYSSEVKIGESASEARKEVRRESQVSDVEWEDI